MYTSHSSRPLRHVLAWLCAMLLLTQTAWSQSAVQGRVVDAQTAEGIAFATVLLRSMADTTHTSATITDLNGGYAFQAIAPDTYRFEISCLGYSPIRIERTIGSEPTQWIDSLQINEQQIDEVRVTTAYGHTANHKTYTFSNAEIKQSQHAHDLLQHLPMIKADPVTGALLGTGNKSVLILLNGVTSTENDIRMLPPNTIKRVEVYDIPPTRYQNAADYVLNVITSTLENGAALGFDLHHGLTTGYGTDNAYLSLVRGHHKISLDYNLDYNDHRNGIYNSYYDYTLNNQTHSLRYNSTEHFADIMHTARLKYTYIDIDKQIAEITLKPSLSSNLSDMTGTGHYEQDGDTYTEDLSTELYDKSRTLNPAADIYYWRKLGSNNELSLNVSAAHFSSNRNMHSSELRDADQQLIYSDTLDLHNTKTSIIGEANYTHSLSIGRWTTGYRVQWAQMNSLYYNTFGNTNYPSSQLQQYIHTELSGLLGQWTYSLSLGATHIHANTGYKIYDQWLFAPRAVLGRGRVRVLYQFFPQHPNIADLSSNALYRSRHIVERGNPNLLSCNRHTLHAIINVADNPYIYAELYPQVGYNKSPIIKRATEVNGLYEIQAINADMEVLMGLGLVLSIYPFGNETLELFTTIVPVYNIYEIDGKRNNWLEAPPVAGFILQLKQFFFQYSIETNRKRLSYDGYLAYTQNIENHFVAQYQLGNWRFKAGLLYAGLPSADHKRRSLIETAPLKYTSERMLQDKRNMITLGLAYHFGKGKDWEYRRKLNNNDSVAPTN